MTDDALWEAFNIWLAGLTGRTVIMSNQDGDRPPLPYIMTNYTTSRPVRDHEQLIEWNPPSRDGEVADPDYPDVTATPVIEREWQYSVHAYSATLPTDILRPLESAHRLSQVLEPVYPGVIFHEMSPIRNVPEWVNNLWEPRANVDIFLRGLTRDGFVIDTIDVITFQHSREGT